MDKKNLKPIYDSFDNAILEDYQSIEEIKESGGLDSMGQAPTKVLGVFKVKHSAGYGIPYGISRNGRLYTKKLWKNAFNDPNFKELYDNGVLVGIIGHPEKNIDNDEALQKGLASHIIKEIKFIPSKDDENSGIIETTNYILDTSAGRTLKAILEAGGKLAVSTRAFGEYKNETYEYQGKKLKVLDENNFYLQTWDVVSIPGIKNARISEVKFNESLKEDLETLKKLGEEYECKDGICNIFEKEDDNIKDEKNDFDYEKIDKETLITLLENVKKENQRLYELLNNGDKKLSKEQKKYIQVFNNFVELLMKLLKYNKNYEKEYETLVEILDKDENFEKEDIKKVKKIIDKVKKDEFADESLLTLADKFLDFIDNEKYKEAKEAYSSILDNVVMNYTMQRDNDVDINMEDDCNVEKPKEAEDIEDEVEQELKQDDNKKANDTEVLKEDIFKNLKRKKYNQKKKDFKIEPPKNKVLKGDWWESRLKEKDILINSLIERIDDIMNQKEEIENRLKSYENMENELKEKNEIIELLKVKVNELSDLKVDYDNLKKHFNELLQKANHLENINEEYKEIVDKVEEVGKIVKEKEGEIERLNKELFEYKVKYFVFRYKISETKAKEYLEVYKDKAENIIKKEVKIIKNDNKDILEKQEVNETKIFLDKIIPS